MPKSTVMFYRGNRWTGRKPSNFLPMGKSDFVVLTRDHRICMSGWPYRGLFAYAWYARTACQGKRVGDLVRQCRRPDVKKVKLSERSAVRHLAALETEYLADVMPIVECLAMLQYDDGSARQPGYFGVWTQGSTWVVRITDKDADAHLTAEGRTADEALDTLAMLLGSENPPWEPCSRRKKKGA